MNHATQDHTAARYFTDEEIACVAHHMLVGLQVVYREPSSPGWARMTGALRQQVADAVTAVRRGATASELAELPGPAPFVSWDALRGGQRVKADLFRLVVAAMAGAER